MTRPTLPPEEMMELAVRVEKATGPDRALDYDVAHFISRAHIKKGRAPAYTSSLDAAMSLPGEMVELLWGKNSVLAGVRDEAGNKLVGHVSGTTPDAAARAVTAAKLKAIAASLRAHAGEGSDGR